MMAVGPETASIRARFAHSLRWSFGSAAFSAVLQLGLAAAMARMLDPAAFGLMAVANGVLRYLRYITDLGIGSTASRAPSFDAEDRTVLTAAALAVSLVLVAGLWLAGPFLVALLPNADAQALSVLHVLAITLVLAAVGDTAAAGLRRDLDFRCLSLAGLAGLVCGQGLIALPLAAMGAGVWALAAGAVVQAAIQSLLLLVHRPLGRWPDAARLARTRKLFGLSGSFLTLRLLDAAFIQFPPLAVGIWVGMTAAGLYDRAFVLAVVPLELVAGSLGKVLQPTFGSMGRDQRHTLGDAFTAILHTLPCLTFPLAAGIALAAPLLTRVAFGPGWEGSADLVKWLVLAAAIRTVAALAGSLVEACGALGLHAAHRLATIGALLLWFRLVPPATAEEVLAAITLVELASATILLVLAARALSRPLASLAAALLPALFPTALVAAAVTATMRIDANPTTSLAVAVAAASVALAFGMLFNPSASLRRTIAARVLGDLLAVPTTGSHPLSRLRRWLAA